MLDGTNVTWGKEQRAPTTSQGIFYNAEVFLLRKKCFSMTTITSVGYLISIYRPSTLDRTIDTSGNTKELENGASTLKDLTLYLGRQNFCLKNYWKTHNQNTYYWTKWPQELRDC